MLYLLEDCLRKHEIVAEFWDLTAFYHLFEKIVDSGLHLVFVVLKNTNKIFPLDFVLDFVPVLDIENDFFNRKGSTQLRILNCRFIQKSTVWQVVFNFVDEGCHVNGFVTKGVQSVKNSLEIFPAFFR